MFDFVLVLSVATIVAIVLIMVYLGVYAYRHIEADSQTHPEHDTSRQKSTH
ncbi:DUF3149 domain-containing protein [Gilvimarinus agarilyticus]|uniref:DUF3149 domain-containing protein n=1 Tax=unclassified Gilvimarinus TaxID=2642066 RepID=UPI001C086B39|nr:MULTISPECIES: DUF3149 domain-containing protein [unclassified Gilvimarinus]MBU2884246.1 DUF3149 domain-containing protein [Gilvimarinus agarilyticus]MDO6569385.1 DUF3149 domain-containing protein [Gilvimarinus sp. 2_MG-2023]MDO6747539.1 DUF3149 domain-containing protein [Gilvimarinus sp. 1_MG-2023]